MNECNVMRARARECLLFHGVVWHRFGYDCEHITCACVRDEKGEVAMYSPCAVHVIECGVCVCVCMLVLHVLGVTLTCLAELPFM